MQQTKCCHASYTENLNQKRRQAVLSDLELRRDLRRDATLSVQTVLSDGVKIDVVRLHTARNLITSARRVLYLRDNSSLTSTTRQSCLGVSPDSCRSSSSPVPEPSRIQVESVRGGAAPSQLFQSCCCCCCVTHIPKK
jgi:hypothetical protein